MPTTDATDAAPPFSTAVNTAVDEGLESKIMAITRGAGGLRLYP